MHYINHPGPSQALIIKEVGKTIGLKHIQKILIIIGITGRLFLLIALCMLVF